MRIAALAAAVSLVLVSACSGTESVQQARTKVDTFHRSLDKADYEAIWSTTSQDMRQPGGKESFIQLLTAVHTKLGAVKETKQIGWQANVNNSGSFAELTMKTTFERGTGEENFIYRNVKGGQQLAGYQIDSTDMMLK